MNLKPLKLLIGIIIIITINADSDENKALESLLLPTEEKIFNHIRNIVKQGIRRPGYQADVWTEKYILKNFREYGLHGVRMEEVTHHGKDWNGEPEINFKWIPLKTVLIVYNKNRSIKIPAFSVPFASSTDDKGLDLEIVALESKRINHNARGKIALYPLRFRRGVSHRLFKYISEWFYDPENTFLGGKQTPCFSVDYQKTMKYAINSGASGYIGILESEDYDIYKYYVPFDGSRRPIPGVYVSKKSGDMIRELMRQDRTRARLVSRVSIEPFVSHNIIGKLSGESGDWIIIGSHHDAPFYGAAQDAAGVSLVLAQAEYWARVPESNRPYNMLFLINSGHICGATGSWTFVREHKSILKSIVLEIHLEEIGMEYTGKNGRFIPTGYGQPWWWFTSQSSRLTRLVQKVIIAEELKRSYIFKPDVFHKKGPVTDGAPFYRKNVPLVNLISAPVYIFGPDDTLEKVNRESLLPITRAVIRIINGLEGISAEQMRDEVKRGRAD